MDGSAVREEEAPRSKKEQIIALYESGTTDIAEIVRRVTDGLHMSRKFCSRPVILRLL